MEETIVNYLRDLGSTSLDIDDLVINSAYHQLDALEYDIRNFVIKALDTYALLDSHACYQQMVQNLNSEDMPGWVQVGKEVYAYGQFRVKLSDGTISRFTHEDVGDLDIMIASQMFA